MRFAKAIFCEAEPRRRKIGLAFVLLPMKHMVVVHFDLRGQRQAAGLADQDLFADLPVGAILTLTNQKLDLFLIAHL
jgi:hypothetical protein